MPNSSMPPKLSAGMPYKCRSPISVYVRQPYVTSMPFVSSAPDST